MFALDVVTVESSAVFETDAFYGIYVMEGEGTLNGQPIKACDHFIVPALCGSVTVNAGTDVPLTFIRCFGPKE